MVMTDTALVKAAQQAISQNKTLYVHAAFGWPMNDENKTRAISASSFNRKQDRLAAIATATADTFGFDCIGFIKALLWGWNGAVNQQYGGAVYQSNGVPDLDEAAMLAICTDVSTDFSGIQAGEYLWTDGHCGIYLGGGLAAECTYRWADGAQATWVYNITGECDIVGRYWRKHGKMPNVSYLPYDKTGRENDYSLSFRYLRKGSKGEDVRAVQELLIIRNYDCGIAGADGIFGSMTERAVRAYQGDCEITVDGIVGKETMRRLVGVVT